MKIVALGLRGFPGVMGGVEAHCEQLYASVRAIAPDIEITALARARYVSGNGSDFKEVKVRPIPAITSPYLEAITHTFLGVLYARFSERADVLHVHAIGPGLLVPLAKILGMSVVFTHHGEDYGRCKWNGAAKMALRLGEALAVRFADRVISVSRPIARSLATRDSALSGKLCWIPNGVSVELGRDSKNLAPLDMLRRFGLEQGKFAMTVARLVPEKGIHDLIDAASGLPEGMKLVIVGGAQMRSGYSDSLLARASDRVIFTGELPREAIAPLYENTALFVLASYHEGLPIAALEALSFGARVLLSDIAANKDLDLPPENYFAVGDVVALRTKVGDIPKIRPADAEAILEKYDWRAIARETVLVFRAAAARRSFGDVGVDAAGGLAS
ncbi:glycosyltransferase family 4 protein [Methylocystis sp. B8]|uniref:glycosyltransferase family 4 protein n=1 Tax=Methylocystis sp. B8 TaxID=544938 RepID=UPI001485762A|nr:glycosyltransferase family 4 protein [Methylocystis sp. B8]